MLTGPALGAAIEKARVLKGVSKAEVARHFKIAGPSYYDWIKHGRIGKQHLNGLAAYFSDVVDHSHWGMTQAPASPTPSQSVSVTPEIVLAAVALAKKTIGLTGDDSFDPAEDPETFAQAINVVLAAAKIQGTGDVDGPAQRIGKAGRSGRAASEAKAGPAVEPARGQRRKSASGSA